MPRGVGGWVGRPALWKSLIAILDRPPRPMVISISTA
jgi:hypothetical protein